MSQMDIRIGTLVNAGPEGTGDYVRQILPHGFESISLTFWQTLKGTNLRKPGHPQGPWAARRGGDDRLPRLLHQEPGGRESAGDVRLDLLRLGPPVRPGQARPHQARRCEHKLPAEYQVDLYMLHAQSGMAFDAGDYDEFLEIAQRYEQKVPDHYMGKAMLASAWACKHARSGDLASRVVALDWLDQARNMAGNDPQFSEYEQRILHHIHSRQIIRAEEFHRRFPDGWTPQEE